MSKPSHGFLEAKAFTAADGERLTVVWWQDRETLRKWQEDLRHVAAKKAGRGRWYEYYKMEVAEVVRQSTFKRSESEANGHADIVIK
jgi:heme-degrading monooxygenase HmoA